MPKKEDIASRIASCRSSYIVYYYRFHCFELIMNLFQEFRLCLILFFFFFCLISILFCCIFTDSGCLLILWLIHNNPWSSFLIFCFVFSILSSPRRWKRMPFPVLRGRNFYVIKISNAFSFQSVNIPNTRILTKIFQNYRFLDSLFQLVHKVPRSSVLSDRVHPQDV